eukprot:Colp12_sorted_trinity150504_noHs@34484
MGSLFRSEEMCLAQLFIQSEASYETVNELGELGLVQFRDLNPNVSAFERNFVRDVRRCEEMERKLRFLQAQIEKSNITITAADENAFGIGNADRLTVQEIDELEGKLLELETEVQGINRNEEMLQRNFLELTELKHILRKTQVFFEEAEHHNFEDETEAVTDEEALIHRRSGRLGFVTGVIEREKILPFERVLWRACRGNVFLRQAPIDGELNDPATGSPVEKNVFIIFFQGEVLENKVKKICEGFGATLYPCPHNQSERKEIATQVLTRVEDLQSVLTKTADHRRRVLSNVALQLESWITKVTKIKAVYHTMNMFDFDVTRKCLIAEAWIPVHALHDVQLALRRATEQSGSLVPSILNRMQTKLKPPTYHKTNKFTEGFQAIIDAYGVASYREVNPGLFTVITFPFLFAVMFGDFGHGILLTLTALAIVLNEQKLASFNGGEMWATLFGGRYLILLMGLFSIYTGLIYNDVFSKSMNLFGSGWPIPDEPPNPNGTTFELIPENFTGAYPFGVDPYWALAENKLTFLNSYKMKMSVILGVIHMCFGISLANFNFAYFGRKHLIFLQYIPQIVFMLCIFGYLTILIFFKWGTHWPGSQAPSLLLTLINMFLKPGSIGADAVLYSGQAGLQSALVLIAVFMVPILLGGNPLWIWWHRRSAARYRVMEPTPAEHHHDEGAAALIAGDQEGVGHGGHGAEEGGHGGHDDEPFSEIMVHQCIHTIEYCLGCISNTASYLRLWALSLAHAQLSEVLWKMVMHAGLTGNCIMLYLCFAFWAALTVAVLLIMEGLSAFLHALRLHWVEFNNKFYEGTGVKFAPFSFTKILKGE